MSEMTTTAAVVRGVGAGLIAAALAPTLIQAIMFCIGMALIFAVIDSKGKM